jgi:hypothetical protein
MRDSCRRLTSPFSAAAAAGRLSVDDGCEARAIERRDGAINVAEPSALSFRKGAHGGALDTRCLRAAVRPARAAVDEQLGLPTLLQRSLLGM